MKKSMGLLIFLCILLTMSVVAAAPDLETKSSQKQVFIVPYVNSTEESKDYVGQTIDEKFKEQFSNEKYQIVSAEIVHPLLAANNFDVSNKELPENEVIMKFAKETDADYVVAMEVIHFINSRHASYFSTSAKSEVKLRYKVYSKATNRITALQVTGKGNNKVTSIGVPGIGTAMKRGLTQAMDEAFVKIQTL